MIVKFTKKQIKALAQIKTKANEMFDEDLKNNLFTRETDRFNVVRCYMAGILECVIKDGAIYGVEV